MAELLLVVPPEVQYAPGTPIVGIVRPGEVAAVQEDGWPWGRFELEPPVKIDHPKWVIVKLPGIPRAALEDFEHSQTVEVGGSLYTVRNRQHYFDLTGLAWQAPGVIRIDSRDEQRTLSCAETLVSAFESNRGGIDANGNFIDCRNGGRLLDVERGRYCSSI